MTTSRRRLVRTVAAMGAVVGLAFASSGCSTTLADAATVNDTHIRHDDFNDELDLLVENDAFVKLLKDSGYKVPSSEVVDNRVAAIWLSQLVTQVAVDEELDARKVRVTDQDRQLVESNIAESFGGADVFNKFPKSFRDEIVDRQARQVALARELSSAVDQPTADDARRFYDENAEAVFACPSAKSVAHIVVASEAEANDVLAQLQGGADFATLAQQRSTDTTTRQQGGVISSDQAPPGCYVTGQSPQLDDAVNGATDGVPAGPVQTQAGYEVLLVRPYTPPTFEEVQDELLAQLQQSAQQQAQNDTQAQLSSVLQKRLRALDVRVDPRYGRWVIDDQGARVEPPDPPDVRETRRKKTPVPTVSVPGVAPGG
jgi:parvulin-like peptidyl-prolyl isomerase